jgi:hypothetical protein
LPLEKQKLTESYHFSRNKDRSIGSVEENFGSREEEEEVNESRKAN